MKRVMWLSAGSVLSSAGLGLRFGREVWLGMMAPLVVVGITWIVTERAYAAHPEQLTSLMIKAFACKLVFFGVYVGLAVGLLGAEPVRFAASFAAYFIVLHAIEALWLKRLFVS